ncbi:hypothetical protein C8A00DRAFT_14558 [Chaetomidium leptoderma]|uniref:Uncharacterized protein n=1 Tax=Chaetomidium leptoderma TaxID=669021 RepID=A0AAN6ZXC3_9PEZI|nr:hypothetical protein C8A00DRAFT_14558 [Chaetomidium leptoderma]
MDRANQSVPWLTPEVQANPHTRILVNGLEVELWQVAHLYGVNHDVPDPMIRSGATSTNIRALYSRPRDEEMASSYPPSDTYAGTTTEGRPLPDSPTLPSRTSVHRGLQCSSVCDDESHGLDTHDLLRMIDELVDEAWLNEAGEEETEYATTASEAAPLGTLTDAERTALSPLPLYANLSFPPPPYPPPTAPLPPLPHDERYGQSLVVLPGTELSSRETELAESLEIDRDNDTASDRTITPISSRRRLATTPQTREVPMPTARSPRSILTNPLPKFPHKPPPTARMPGVTQVVGRATSASIIRNHGPDGYRHYQQDAGLNEPLPKLPLSVVQHPLPSFLQNPPLFLQHPPDFSQQPPQYQRPRGDTGESPRPIKSKSSPNLEVPTRPVTPAADGDTGLTSRWSPDSSPEISRFKRVRNKFSLARLQPQKSRLFQTENEADESAAPVGNSTSDPSGPRRGSRKASQ